MSDDAMHDLREVMARLRDPEHGCPWDVKQTFETIAPYTIEEAFEVADAIEREDLDGLKGELGDLLFQVVFHSRMAEEQGAFDLGDVARAMTEKLVRRHPHVFADSDASDEAELKRDWERHKLAEQGEDGSALDGVGRALPALMRAAKLQRRAAATGFDWPRAAPVLDKVREEIEELAAEMDGGTQQDREAELGDLLFAVVNLSRHLGVDPEAALRGANAKFERRFRSVERQARDSGHDPSDLSLEVLDGYWDHAKATERDAGNDPG